VAVGLGLVSCLMNGGCFAAGDFRVQGGASHDVGGGIVHARPLRCIPKWLVISKASCALNPGSAAVPGRHSLLLPCGTGPVSAARRRSRRQLRDARVLWGPQRGAGKARGTTHILRPKP
jgi:hypothetical protein